MVENERHMLVYATNTELVSNASKTLQLDIVFVFFFYSINVCVVCVVVKIALKHHYTNAKEICNRCVRACSFALQLHTAASRCKQI